MYDLRLTEEQQEMRDTVRAFTTREVRALALDSQRLLRFEKPLLGGALDGASEMGLRALTLSEALGGAGADHLTACIVLEELAAGDVDLAVVLAHTAAIAHIVFDTMMTPAQRDAWLPEFLSDPRHHLALAGPHEAPDGEWHYPQPPSTSTGPAPFHARRDGTDWIVEGAAAFVANAPLARHFVVRAGTDPAAPGEDVALLVPRDTPGVSVGRPPAAVGDAGPGGEPLIRWHHGAGAALDLRECRVPAEHLLDVRAWPGGDGRWDGCGDTMLAAVNLGVGRAAHEAAVDYARVRRQGGRNIIGHQAIGALLADGAVKIEAARNLIWKAAWIADHPAHAAQVLPGGAPLDSAARSFTAAAMHEVTEGAAECFGAMGVMRDMPMQKYVHDALVFLHAPSNDRATPLAVARALAG